MIKNDIVFVLPLQFGFIHNVYCHSQQYRAASVRTYSADTAGAGAPTPLVSLAVKGLSEGGELLVETILLSSMN